MFKELKIVKLIIVVGLIVFIVLNHPFFEQENNIILTKHSYFSNEIIQLKSGSADDHKLYNISKDQIVKASGSEFKLASGGLYDLNDFPIVVKDDTPKDLIVVFPYMNNLLYKKNEEGKILAVNFTEAKVQNHTSAITEIDRNLFHWINEKNHSVISEIDLENYNYISKSKVILIYSNVNFLNQSIMDNLIKYVSEGGILIVMSNQFGEYNVNITHEQISQITNENGEWSRPNPKIPLFTKYGGKAKNCYIKTIAAQLKPICIFSQNWSAPYNTNVQNDISELAYIELTENNLKNEKSYISLFKSRESNGKVLLVGSHEFFLDDNYKHPEVKEFLDQLFTIALN